MFGLFGRAATLPQLVYQGQIRTLLRFDRLFRRLELQVVKHKERQGQQR